MFGKFYLSLMCILYEILSKKIYEILPHVNYDYYVLNRRLLTC